MANEPLLEVDVAEYLQAQGFGAYSGDKTTRNHVIFVGEEPARKTATITVLEDGGGPGQNPWNQSVSEAPSFTVRVTHPNYTEGRSISQRIRRSLHNQQGILANVQVARILADVASPLNLGRDQNKRHIFTMTFSAVTKLREPLP